MSDEPQNHELFGVNGFASSVPYSGRNSTIHAETVHLRLVAAPVSYENSLLEMRLTNQKDHQEWAVRRSQQFGTLLLIELQGARWIKEKNPYHSER